jgi:hypothetical protein
MTLRLTHVAVAAKVACRMIGDDRREAQLQRLRRELAAARAAAIAAAPPRTIDAAA